jgi:hypothetical protein
MLLIEEDDCQTAVIFFFYIPQKTKDQGRKAKVLDNVRCP